MPIIQIPVLFDVSGTMQIYGEDTQGQDFIESHLQFTLDIEIPDNKFNELLILINIANQNSKEGFFVFDFKLCKINFNLISSYSIKTEEISLDDFFKINLDFTNSLFHNFVSGVHNLFYGEKIESASLELLFLNNEGCA